MPCISSERVRRVCTILRSLLSAPAIQRPLTRSWAPAMRHREQPTIQTRNEILRQTNRRDDDSELPLIVLAGSKRIVQGEHGDHRFPAQSGIRDRFFVLEVARLGKFPARKLVPVRSEEHTSELQSLAYLV